jgi:hypothetical protein
MATTPPRRVFHPAPAARVHRHRDHGLLPASRAPEVDPADVPRGRDYGLMLWIFGLKRSHRFMRTNFEPRRQFANATRPPRQP